METEAVTRYVQRDPNGRVVAITNEYAAERGYGVAETVTVPAENEVRALLLGVEGAATATRSADYLMWAMSPERGFSATGLADRVTKATGWRISVSSGGGFLYVWPTVTTA